MVYRGKRRKKKKEREIARGTEVILSPRSPHTRLQVDSVNASAGENAGSATLLYRASLLFFSFFIRSLDINIYTHPPVAPREIHVYLSWRIERGVTRAP